MDYDAGISAYKLDAYRLNEDGGTPTGWSTSGVLLSTPGVAVGSVFACSDGAGGYYISRDEYTLTNGDIYLQHLDSNGITAPGWPALGLRLNRGTINEFPLIQPDGLGGAIVIAETEDTNQQHYAFRVNADGSLAWPGLPNGALLDSRPFGNNIGRTCSDGLGGAYAVMNFSTSNFQSDLYLQHVLANGSIAPGWATNDTRITSVLGQKSNVSCTSDGNGGVFLGWADGRGLYYLQHIVANSSTSPGWPVNGLPAILTPDYQDSGALTTDASGGIYCAVHNSNAGRVSLTHLAGSGAPVLGWPAGGVDASPDFSGVLSSSSYLLMTSDGRGGAIAAWSINSNPSYPSISQLIRLGQSDIVAAEVALQSSEATPTMVTMRWLSPGQSSESFQVQRMVRGGEWENIGTILPDGSGQLTMVDRAIEPGLSYGYRLSTIGTAAHVVTAETWVEVPAAFRFALTGARPNPSTSSALTIEFSLSQNLPAALEMYDLSGRRVVIENVGSLGAGDHTIRLRPTSPVSAGMYWLRLTQGANSATARIAVVSS